MEFQRARTAEQTANRQNEIITAAKELYSEKGFEGVHFKAISEKTSFSRPTIYNYYKTKEEVLLDVLKNEYLKWGEVLKAKTETISPDELCAFLPYSLKNRDIFLKLLSVDYTSVETGCTEEKLTEYKTAIQPVFSAFRTLTDKCFPNSKEKDKDLFNLLFFSLLGGLYSQLNLSEKQLNALRKANPNAIPPDYYETFYRALVTITKTL